MIAIPPEATGLGLAVFTIAAITAMAWAANRNRP